MRSIRSIKIEDLDKLAEIYVTAYNNSDAGEEWTKSKAKSLIRFYLEKQPDLSFCVEEDDQLKGGFVVGIMPWWDGNHLYDGEIFIDPNYHHRGFGKDLLKKVFQEALDKYQVVTWDFTTFKNLDFPISWYKKLGFRENREWITMEGSVEEALKKLEEE